MNAVKSRSVLRSVPSQQTAPTESEILSNLMIQAGRGNEAAFADLYDLLAPLVYGIVLKVVRDPAISAEVTQEIFLELWKTATRYSADRGAVKSFVATISHRRAVDRVRSEQSRRDREEREHRLAVPPPDSLEEAIADSFQLSRIEKALETLTPAQRQALELAYYGGHTYREVATLLGEAEGTIKTRIRDGLIKVRDHLGVAK